MEKQELEYIPLGESDRYFTTHDLGASAALIVQGYELASLDKGVPQKVKFIFKGGAGISRCLQDYWDNKLQGSLQDYFNALKRLKNQIYSE
jgi:hypothetical protein